MAGYSAYADNFEEYIQKSVNEAYKDLNQEDISEGYRRILGAKWVVLSDAQEGYLHFKKLEEEKIRMFKMTNKEKINQKVIDNFISTIDLKMKMTDNLENAFRDYVVYGWTIETLFELTKTIAKMYSMKKD